MFFELEMKYQVVLLIVNTPDSVRFEVKTATRLAETFVNCHISWLLLTANVIGAACCKLRQAFNQTWSHVKYALQVVVLSFCCSHLIVFVIVVKMAMKVFVVDINNIAAATLFELLVQYLGSLNQIAPAKFEVTLTELPVQELMPVKKLVLLRCVTHTVFSDKQHLEVSASYCTTACA